MNSESPSPNPPCFAVYTAVFLADVEARSRMKKDVAALERVEAEFFPGQPFNFSFDFLDNEDGLDSWRNLQYWQPSPRSLLILSDGLIGTDVRGGFVPTTLALDVRKQFLDSPHLCGLVALHPGVKGRGSDIDRALDLRLFDLPSLRAALVKTATGLRLKAPPGRRGDESAFEVNVVPSRDDLRRCFTLRRLVYDMMGYLPEAVSANASNLELDAFDVRAVHFMATHVPTGDLAGTMRLVLSKPQECRDAVCQGAWGRNIGIDAGEPFTRFLHAPPFWPLPILASADFRDKWPEMLERAEDAAEVSRLIVAPRYRGFGLSRLLVRAGLAKALELGKSPLLLECIPAHRVLYAKFGFNLLTNLLQVTNDAVHCRPGDLDQQAVGMYLDLNQTGAATLARKDLELIRSRAPEAAPPFGRFHVSVG